MPKYRFTFSSRLGTRIVIPLDAKGWQKNYDKKDNKAEFEETFNGDLLLAAADFQSLYQLEKLVFRNEYVKVKIDKKCGTGFSPFFAGNISLNMGIWDLERCTVTFKFAENEKYLLWESNKEVEVDAFQLTPDRTTVKTLTGELERTGFNGQGPTGMEGYNVFPGIEDPASKGWIMDGYESQKDVTEYYTYNSYWVREIYNGAGTPSGVWYFDADVNKYVRTPVITGKTTTYGPNNTISYGATVFSSTIDNGLVFNEFLKLLINKVLPGVAVQSDFFQINPITIPSQINYVTGQPSKVNNLAIFQKSDVKRAADFQNATKFKVVPSKLIEGLCNTFQLEWYLKGNVFIIEHVKYKNRVLGLDTTGSPTNKGRRRYSYDNDKIPQKETFNFMETSSGDFAGVPIIYSGANVAKGTKKEENHQVETITTDVIFCLQNPEPSGKVSDDGMVLIATDGNGTIISEPSILGGNQLNNSLAWAQLQRDYWRYNRAQRNFNMNNVDTVALSVKPTKLEEDVTIKICCGQVFDPDKLIKTNLGIGILRNAKYEMFKELLNVSVLFDAEEGLINVSPPVAVTDNVSTYGGVDVSVDVLTNDTSQAGINRDSLVIVQQPAFGNVIITSDKKIVYTPNSGYIGKDYVLYRFSDIYGQPSNNGLIAIDVLGGVQLPIANPDVYTTSNKTDYNVIASVGLIANDAGPAGMTITPETKTTTKGSTVIIYADGSFKYIPLVGLVGADTFTYTLNDLEGNTAEGSVTVNVFNALEVYISLVRISGRTQNNTIECIGGPAIGGFTFYGTYVLRFFSDAGRTIPLNVNGYNLKVNIRNRQTNADTGNDVYNFVDEFTVLGGTEVLYKEDFIEYDNVRNCAGEELHLQGELSIENTGIID